MKCGDDAQPLLLRGVLRLAVRHDAVEALLCGGVQVVILLVQVVQQAPDEPVREESRHSLGLAQRQQLRKQPEPEVPPLVRPRREQPVFARDVPERLNRAGHLDRALNQAVPHAVYPGVDVR